MNLYETSTYPPSPPPPTTMQPPPSSTASTGAPAEVGWMLPAILALVVIGAFAIRIATNRTRRFTNGTV